jgi:hypothetical protein
MDSYPQQLAIEALVVGATTVGGFMIVSNTLPTIGLLPQLFVTGVAIHLTFEAAGWNKWYLTNGAASFP